MYKNNKKVDVLQFIELYRSHELLWNKNISLYRRCDLKMKAYENIGRQMKMSVENVKRKIKSLRTAYSHEKSKVERSKTSGSESIYEPSVYWYDEMTFLDECLESADNSNHVNTSTLPETLLESETNDMSYAESHPSHSKKRKYLSEPNTELDESFEKPTPIKKNFIVPKFRKSSKTNEKMLTQKCRTCLKTSTKTFALTNSVPGCTPEITYAQILKDYLQLEYNTTYERNLPQFLCFLCCSQLKSTYIFIQQAQKCNMRLINDLTKQLCLQEEVIDLPQLQEEDSLSHKSENSDNHEDLKDQYIPNKFNLTANEAFTEEQEPNLTTEQIIEYDSEDNLLTNTFEVEPTLKTEQIIEFDVEDGIEMDNDNIEFNENTVVINCKEDPSLANEIETLESVDVIQCPICNEQMDERDKLTSHMRIHYDVSESVPPKEQILPCRYCDHVAKTTSSLRYHTRSKHPTEYKELKCKFCPYSTIENKYTLLHHIKTVHKELIKKLRANAFSNTEESIIENTNNELNDILISTLKTEEENLLDGNNKEQDKEDELCNENFIRNMLNMRKKTTTKNLVARCDECGKILKNYRTLFEHKRHVHKSEDMFSACPHCEKKCKRESDLKIHIRQMHGPIENRQIPKPRSKEKRFMCAECSYTCTTSTLLKIHVRIHHTGEKPYKCEICSKSFVLPFKLKIHRYSHTGEKPYKCPICFNHFRDPSTMRKHKRLHTIKHPYKCEDCGKGFTQSYTLTVHKRKHLKQNQLSCSVCDKVFENKSMLNIHQINENHYDEIA